jgi:peptidyl-tRNA hydrolase, PTH1 family
VKIVLGLGNPGKQYERTRHNLGFLVLDRVAAIHRLSLARPEFQSLTGSWKLDGEEALLVKPQTYMNRSGLAVRDLFDGAGANIKDLVVVHDDLDLPFGRLRIRSRGGSGGHQGIQSILEALGTEYFFRVRVGIGRPPPGVEAIDFVLETFSAAEAALLDGILNRGADAVAALLREGPQRTMERFNRAE